MSVERDKLLIKLWNLTKNDKSITKVEGLAKIDDILSDYADLVLQESIADGIVKEVN